MSAPNDAHLRAMYVCRACGYKCAYPSRYRKCPVCGIHWG
jgi:rubrerythrin